jgi:hypothetical protein
MTSFAAALPGLVVVPLPLQQASSRVNIMAPAQLVQHFSVHV